MFRDGDAFAAAGAALCLLSAWAIGQAFARGALARWLAVTIMAAVLVPALHWMAHFNQTARGLERIEAYLAEPPKPPEDVCAMTWNFLGERYARMDRWPDAARAQAEAARLAPHRRIFLQWGIAATTAGTFSAAQRAYRELLARDDADPLAWLGLAGVSIRLGDRDEATRALDRLRGFAEIRTRRRRSAATSASSAWCGRDRSSCRPIRRAPRPAEPTRRARAAARRAGAVLR